MYNSVPLAAATIQGRPRPHARSREAATSSSSARRVHELLAPVGAARTLTSISPDFATRNAHHLPSHGIPKVYSARQSRVPRPAPLPTNVMDPRAMSGLVLVVRMPIPPSRPADVPESRQIPIACPALRVPDRRPG
ncbi:hypothetical protein MN608_02999 [Microdochium nivale]|nr:hypothetical protein MN608_02999 [Microdochium nivale]